MSAELSALLQNLLLDPETIIELKKDLKSKQKVSENNLPDNFSESLQLMVENLTL